MRSVTFNNWIPVEYELGNRVPGIGEWEKGFPNYGAFLGWGIACEEFNAGIGNYTVALVELHDGTVKEMLLSNGYGYVQ